MGRVFPSTFWHRISSHLLNITVSEIVKYRNNPLFLSTSSRFWSSYKDSGPSLIKLVLSYITLSMTSCHNIFTQTGWNRSKFTSTHLTLVKLYEVVSLRVTKFPQTKVYVHSLQEQEWHGHWQVPAALLAWADMLSNPILGSADLPITAVHERSALSFVITTQKTD